MLASLCEEGDERGKGVCKENVLKEENCVLEVETVTVFQPLDYQKRTLVSSDEKERLYVENWLRKDTNLKIKSQETMTTPIVQPRNVTIKPMATMLYQSYIKVCHD